MADNNSNTSIIDSLQKGTDSLTKSIQDDPLYQTDFKDAQLRERVQTNNSSNFAQNPSPAFVDTGSYTSNVPTLQSTLRAPVDSVLPMALINAGAINKGAPLVPEEAAAATGQTAQINPAAYGGGGSVSVPMEPQPVAQQAPAAPQKSPYPFEESYKLAENSIKLGVDAGTALAAAKEKMATDKLAYDEQYAAKMQKAQENFDVKYQEKMDDLNANVKEYRALAGEKVIPGAFLARQDTQSSIMTGLSIALGGLGAAFSGTNGNVGLELINKAIDRDVEAQRFNLDTKIKLKKYEADTNENLLGKMREKFSDDRSAYLATKVAMLAMTEDKFNQQINQKENYADLASQAAAQQARAQLKSQREVYEMQLKQAQEAQFSQQQFLLGKDKRNLTNEEAVVAYGKDAEKYVQGFGPALSKEDKKAFQESYGESKASLEALHKLLSMDMNKLDPIKRAEVATELNLLTGKMRLAVLGPGAMTEKEFDRLVETLGDPNAVIAFPGSQRKKMETVKNRLQAQQDAQVKQYFGNKVFNELQQSKGKINFK